MNIGMKNQDYHYGSEIINKQLKIGTHAQLKIGMENWMNQFKPDYFVTITSREIKSDYGFNDTKWLVGTTEFIKSLNKLFHWVQSDLFGRQYLRYGDSIRGIGCVERQSNYQPHAHLALKLPQNKTAREFKRSILSKSDKIRMFSRSGIDIQRINSDEEDYAKIGSYISKLFNINSGLISISKGELG